ncbi:MAG: CPBP family intramembrane glutamic endopeptidase [Terracidiphilus sp.]
MSGAQNLNSLYVCATNAIPVRRRARDICDVLIGYGLILLAIWTPRPEQRWFYWAAVAWFVVSIASSHPVRKELGFHIAGFWRSLWVVGVAAMLAAGATVLASDLHTLHHPTGIAQWVTTFGGYAVWSLMQQFLMQEYFLLRLLRLLPSPTWAATTAAGIFALAHLPNPILTPVTLLWGFTACLIFLKFRNIYPLAIAHAIFGICIAITIPGPVVHNMRVGLGYLRYRAPRPLHLSQSDQRVSTVAWVMADAATRRPARHALP